MKKLTTVAALFVILFTFNTSSVQAQHAFELRGGVGTVDMLENYNGFIGAGFWLQQESWPIAADVNVGYHFAGDISGFGAEFSQNMYSINAAAVYRRSVDDTFSLYGGGGPAVTYLSVDGSVNTGLGRYQDSEGSLKMGAVLLGGVDADFGAVRPFAQGEITLGGKHRIFDVNTNGGSTGHISFGIRLPVPN